MDEMFKNFIEPGVEFRPVPFWSWNDDLEEGELRRQIKEMKKSGYGGYFMHARVGLVTPYMGEKWMEMIKIAIDEGEKNGMKPWLYDENKWPSGFAGGMVPKQNVDFRFKYVVCITNHQIDQILKQQLHSQISQVRDESFLLHQFTRENMIFEMKIDDVAYHFHEWIAPLGDKWYNDTCYVDLMYPETVKAFIDLTYEKYYKECGEYFGGIIPGIFTDEPTIYSYTTKFPFKAVPWSKNFRKSFQEMNGYDLVPQLIKLFIDLDDYKKVRYDYYKTMSCLFVESYSKQIYEWCREHKLVFTGHYLGEDNFMDIIMAISNAMPHYEYQTYPGIDMLGDRVGTIGTLLTIKQVSSVAEQLKKERVLSETYGGGGWNFSFTGQKLMAEIQLALGVNLLNPHLALYSMRGERKRDFPPSLFYQQPYWGDYKNLNDYLSKLCYILTEGRRDINILVIHPIESVWMDYTPNDKSKVIKTDADFAEFITLLLNSQKDFHLGDETIIANHGSVQKNKFVIGEYKYDFVILPSLQTLRRSTYKLLEKYSEAGGNVIAINDFPCLLDGEISTEPKLNCNNYRKEEFSKNIETIIPQKITITGKNSKNILIHHRIKENTEIYYFLNNHLSDVSEVEIRINSFNGIYEEWNAVENTRIIYNSDYREGFAFLKIILHPGESKILIHTAESETGVKKAEISGNEVENILLDGEYKILESDLNSLTLDFCQYKIDGNGYSKILPVLDVQNQSKNFGGKKITMKYEFEIESYPSLLKEIYLAFEYKEGLQVLVNGKNIEFNRENWWVDISFKKSSIKESIRQGINIIEIETNLEDTTELEAIYILGDFCLKNYSNRLFSIIRRENILQISDFTKSGYPFFNGKITLTKTFSIPDKIYRKCILKLKSLDSMIIKVGVNNEDAGFLAWNPLELDLTKYIKAGSNQLTLQLISSCRNLLGPHHYKGDTPLMTCPEHFYDDKKWDSQYSFVPFGLTVTPEIVLIN